LPRVTINDRPRRFRRKKKWGRVPAHLHPIQMRLPL
jgi:hypothetical protein